MAAGREARLILRLIDGVSGPAKGVVGALGRVNASTKAFAGAVMAPARGLNRMGRNMRHHAADATMMSAAVSVGLMEAGKAVYEYEKEGNRMQAFGLLNDKQRHHLESEAKRLNKFFPQTNKGILEAASELFRAGLTYEQALGALEGSLQLSLAGDIDTQSAADIATNIMYAMKLPMKTTEEVAASLQKINDLLAYGAAESNTDIKLMSDTFRYVGPLAAIAGMSIEEVTGLTMELAKAGIKGAEAGVALRSGLVRMAKPTKPMIAAFNRLNINMKDFVQYKQKIEASTITSSLLADGYDMTALNGQIQKILDDKTLAMAPQRMLSRLADLVVDTIGDETVRDKITETLQDAILAGGQKVDLVKLLRVLKGKGATITDIAQIFDQRMGARLAAILYNDLDVATAKVTKEYRGTTDKMAKAMTKGVVGTWLDFTAAVENFSITVASRSGAIEAAGSLLGRMSDAADSLAETSPGLLKFATYAAMALAVLAPLGFAASGVASSLALMVNPLSWVVAGLAYFGTRNFDAIVSWMKAFGKTFKDNLSPKVVNAFGAAVDKVKTWTGQLTNAGKDGEAWGRTSKEWAEASAAAFNKLYDIGEKIVTSKFFTGFQQGFGTAMENMAGAAQQLANAMGPLGANMQPFIDFMNSNAGENIGKILGEISGYGLGLTVAAAGIGLVATAIGALGRSLLALSGARVGMTVLGGLAGLFGFGGGGGSGGGKLGKKPPRKMPKGAGWFAMPAILGSIMYALKDYKGGVWELNPPKPRPNAIVDYVNAQHKKSAATAQALPETVAPPPLKPQPVINPKVLADYQRPLPDNAVDEAERKLNTFATNSEVAGQKAKDALSITANPIIDSSSLDSFLAKIGRAIAGMRSLGAGAGLPTLNYTGDHTDSSSRPGIGARASGGPVRRGLTYEINERGRETVTMGTNGYVTPAHRTGGDGGFHIENLVIHGANTDDVMSKLRRELNRALDRSRQLSLDDRPVTT